MKFPFLFREGPQISHLTQQKICFKTESGTKPTSLFFLSSLGLVLNSFLHPVGVWLDISLDRG